MKIWQYGRFGLAYGAWIGTVTGVLLSLYAAAFTLLNWPKDGTVRWFMEGFFSILLFSIAIGWLLGSIGGFIFGLIGSFGSNPIIWAVGGIIGGSTSFLLLARILFSLSRNPFDFPSFLSNMLPVALIPSLILAVIGWCVGLALRTGMPKMPLLSRLDHLRDN